MNNNKRLKSKAYTPGAYVRQMSLSKFLQVSAWVAIIFVGLSALTIYVVNTAENNRLSRLAAARQSRAEITITNEGFVPAVLQIKQGATVSWTNMSDKSHHVAANPYPEKTSLPELDSDVLTQYQEYQLVFDKPGTYTYSDYLNPTVGGTIIVD